MGGAYPAAVSVSLWAVPDFRAAQGGEITLGGLFKRRNPIIITPMFCWK
jgi:hypothetical protein